MTDKEYIKWWRSRGLEGFPPGFRPFDIVDYVGCLFVVATVAANLLL